MKKIVYGLAILTMISAMVSCGKTDGNTESATTVTTTSSVAATTTAANEKSESTTAASASDKTQEKASDNAQDPAKEEKNEALVLEDRDRLFSGYVATDSGDLNLRAEPFPTADVLASIPKDTRIEVYSCGKAGWYCTSYNGKAGYVSADYVKEIAQENNQTFVTDISELVGQWKYQTAPEGMNITAGVIDNGIIEVNSDGTYVYTDLDGKTHSGTVKVDYDTFAGDYSVPLFAFYEGDKFFIGCYCNDTHSDVYMTGNGGVSQIARIK